MLFSLNIFVGIALGMDIRIFRVRKLRKSSRRTASPGRACYSSVLCTAWEAISAEIESKSYAGPWSVWGYWLRKSDQVALLALPTLPTFPISVWREGARKYPQYLLDSAFLQITQEMSWCFSILGVFAFSFMPCATCRNYLTSEAKVLSSAHQLEFV